MAAAKKKSPRKKKTVRKRSTAKSHSFRLWLSTLFLVAFVGSCLYGLVHLQSSYPEKIAPSYAPAPMEEPHSVIATSATPYTEIYRMLEAELLTGQDAAGWQQLESSDGVRRLKMFGRYPEQLQLMELATRIALTNSPARLDLAPRTGYVRLLWEGSLRVELHYDVTEEVRSKRPQIAIIMDDMGRSMSDFERLLELKIPVTPAILPQADHATRSTALLEKTRHEFMIHIPMQPNSYPAISPGPNALLVDLDENELRQRVRSYLRLVPGAVGGNNHMGSLFTQHREPMRVVLEELQRNGLFFIDSRTIGGSVAFDQARRMGMRTAQRHIFLDNEENVDYIRAQLRKMVKVAEEKGEAIAICHPYRETFEVLQAEQDWLRQQPVDFVVASRLASKR